MISLAKAFFILIYFYIQLKLYAIQFSYRKNFATLRLCEIKKEKLSDPSKTLSELYY